MDDVDETLRKRWFPVSRSEEIVPRHVAQVQLLGQEIALWRDDAGTLNAWENRCPHRGVRLSIGINDGTELRCRYHGWRYASGTGQCTFIPAHPGQKPANAIRATPYGVGERYGFVWVSLDGGEPDVPALDSDRCTTLRSIFVEAPASLVAAHLPPESEAILLVQPVNAQQSVIHALLPYDVAAADRLAVLRRWNTELSRVRDAIESMRDGT